MKIKFLFMIFILCLFFSSYVYASAKIIMPTKDRHVYYEPNKDYNWSYFVGGANHIDVELSGELKNHAELIDKNPGGSSRTVTVIIHSPDYLSPGTHYLYISAKENNPKSFVGGVAKVRVPMTLTKHSIDPYISANINSFSVEEGKPANITIDVSSLSLVSTNNIRGKFSINDVNDSYEEKLLLITLPSLEEKSVETVINNVANLKPGDYNLNLVITYQGMKNPIKISRNFKVGYLSFIIKNQPKKLVRGKINKVTFLLKNKWNQQLNDVEPIVNIPALSVSETSPRKSILPFSQNNFNYYIDVFDSAELTSYNGSISMVVEGKNIVVPFNITVVDHDDSLPVVEEKPSKFNFTINPLILAYVLVFLLVIINLILLFRKKK